MCRRDHRSEWGVAEPGVTDAEALVVAAIRLGLLGLAQELVQAGGVCVKVKDGGAELAQDLVPFRLRQASLFEAADEPGDVLAFLSKLAKKHIRRGRWGIRFPFSYCFHPVPLSRFRARSIPFSNARISRSQ